MPTALSLAECNATILNHIRAMHEFYGEIAGVRIARKHIGWYIDEMPEGEQTRRDINRLDSAAAQYDTLAAYLETLSEKPTAGYATIGKAKGFQTASSF